MNGMHEVATTWRRGARIVTPGVELSIRGERGRFRFRQHVTTRGGIEWIDVIGGPAGRDAFRSFRPEQVRTVHITRKARPAAAGSRAARVAVAA